MFVILVGLILCTTFVTSNENYEGPSILSNPVDTIAQPGIDISLYCITRGQPTPSVTWEKDDVPLKGSHFEVLQNGGLRLKKVDEYRDSGNYRCRSSNPVGEIKSLPARLDFPFLDKFSQPFQKVKANNADAVILRCQIPNMKPRNLRTVRWSKKDFQYTDLLPPLEDAPHYTVGYNGDLYFSYATTADSGSYVCVVGNTMLGRTEKRTLKLAVAVPIEQRYEVKQPGIFSDFKEPKYAIKGKTFVLECIAHGRPVPRVSLTRLGQKEELGKTSSNKRQYIIYNFDAKNAGTYVCRARNSYGDWYEATTTVTMLEETQWIKRPTDASVDVNSSLTLQCEAKGVPPITYAWFYNGIRMMSSGNKMNYVINEGSLWFPSVQVGYSGMYQCEASNSVKKLMTSMRLSVKAAAPSFTDGAIAPDEVTNAVVSGTISLRCKPIGSPKPQIFWFKGSTRLSSNGKYTVDSDGLLRIHDVKKSDRGTYICVGRNSFGVARKETYLLLKNGLVIVNFPRHLDAIVGRNLTIVCEVALETKSVVTFKWSQNLQPLTERNIKITNTERRSVLFINSLTKKNSAVYICEAIADGLATAGRSKDTADIRIQVEGPPEPPIWISVSAVRKHHVNITWKTRDVSENWNRKPKIIVEYKTLYEKDVWYSIGDARIAGDNMVEIKISPWAFYIFRIVLMNEIGRSQPSPESGLIQSPAAAPDKAPSNITGSSDSATELTISWKPLKPIEHNGPGLSYAVFYRRVSDPSPMIRVQVAATTAKSKLEHTIRDTEFYEQFEFQVQAINALGQGPRSEIVYGHSGEKSPVGEPRNLRVQIINSRSARATWSGIKNDRKTRRGKLLGYKVYYWSTQYGLRPSDANYEPTDDTVTVVGLESFTTYFFQVVAYNSKGDGPGSNIVGPLSTPESVPGTPYSLDVVMKIPEVTLKWKPPLKTNGIMVGYQVTVRKLPIGQINIIDVSNQRLEQEFEALDLNAKYQFALLARNRVGFGPPLVLNIDLGKVPKRPPEDVYIAVNARENTATIKWSKVEGEIHGYRVTYWNTKDGPEKSTMFQEVDEKDARQVVVNLKDELTYMFHVQAYVEFGDSIVLGPISSVQSSPTENPLSDTNSATVSDTRTWLFILGYCLVVCYVAQ